MVRLWETSSGTLVRELSGHLGHVYSLEFHPDGKTLLSGDLLGVIKEWDLASGKAIGGFDAKALHHLRRRPAGGFRRCSRTGHHAGRRARRGRRPSQSHNPLGAVHEPIALIFDAKSRKIARTLLADGIARGVIWRLRYLADGSLMGACGGTSGGFLLFWKSGTDKDYHRLALPNIARDMDLHPDGLRVATAHHDGHLRITRLAAGTS